MSTFKFFWSQIYPSFFFLASGLSVLLKGFSCTSRVYTHSTEAASILSWPRHTHLTDLCVCNSRTRCFVVFGSFINPKFIFICRMVEVLLFQSCISLLLLLWYVTKDFVAYITGITVFQLCRPEVQWGSWTKTRMWVGPFLPGGLGRIGSHLFSPWRCPCSSISGPFLRLQSSTASTSTLDTSQDSSAFEGSRDWFGPPRWSGVSSPFQGPWT